MDFSIKAVFKNNLTMMRMNSMPIVILLKSEVTIKSNFRENKRLIRAGFGM